MTVYALNNRTYDQSAVSTPAAKGSASAADDFLAILSQAEAQVGARTGANAAPSAEKALAQAFNRPVDQPRQDAAAAKTPRTQSRDDARAETKDDSRAAQQTDEGQDDAPVRAVSRRDQQQDDVADTQDDTQAAADDEVASAAAPVVEDEPAPDPTLLAAVVDVPQQVVEARPVAQTQTGPAQPEESAGPLTEVPADDAAPLVADADQDAAAQTTFTLPAQQAAAQGGSRAAKHADARAQADDLAARLDDTGAQLNVQVQVTEARPAAQTATTATDLSLAQDLDSQTVLQPVQAVTSQSSGQSQGDGGAAMAQAGQTGTAQTATTQANTAVDAFAAVLLASQAESAGPAETGNAAGGGQTQPVAALGAASGTQATARTAAAQAPAPARPQQLPDAKEVMDQIKVQIAKQGANGDTIKVQLKPVELGSIEVKLDVAKDGSVSGVVTADNKETLAMLKNDSRSLEKALSDAGFKADAGSLSFNLRGENQQQTAQDGTQTRRSRRAAAALGGLDATQGSVAAQAQARFAGGRSGVDIQV